MGIFEFIGDLVTGGLLGVIISFFEFIASLLGFLTGVGAFVP